MISDKYGVTGSYVIGGILLFIGIWTTPVGLIGFISSGFSYIGLVLLVLGLSGILLLISGVQYIRQGRKLQQDEKELQTELANRHTPGTPETAAGKAIGSEILAEWIIDKETWQAFAKNEKKYRTEDNIYYFIGVLIIGTIGLMIMRAATLFIAFAISAILGGIIVWMRYSFAMGKLSPANKKSSYAVIIAKGFVILNGHTFDLYSKTRNVRKLRFLPDEKPALLEFTLEWKTRNGVTFDELRIPVPPEQFQTAIDITKQFNHTA